MRRALAAGAGLLLGCTAMQGPMLDPQEHVRGEHQRLLQEPVAQLWPALLQALSDEGLRVARADQARGTIATGPVRYDEHDVVKRLAEIGDLARAREAGLRRISDLNVTYYLLLTPAGDAGTSLRIRSTIQATDRSEAMYLGPGLLQVIPRTVEVPSRGVAERELMRHLGASLFTTEEMLFLLGEPGVD